MILALGTAAGLLLLLQGPPPDIQEVTQTLRGVTVRADTRWAYPGGLITVRLASRRRLGNARAIFAGRRVRFLSTDRGPRALLPVPVGTPPGPATLGVELRGRRRRRMTLEVQVAEREYPARAVILPTAQRALLVGPNVLRDGRRVLQALRTVSPEGRWKRPFEPPLAPVSAIGFGGVQVYLDSSAPVDSLTDSIFGNHHRGLDFDAAVGTPVRAPAAGRVSLSDHLTLSGGTLVIDHGHGVHSVFFHLSQLAVPTGAEIERSQHLGLTGATGLTAFPHLHWGVYAHEVAVDPAVFLAPER